MLESIRYHLLRLGDFAGREGRRTFWFWLLALVIVNFVVIFAMSAVLTAGAMSAAMEHVGSGDELAIQKAVLEQTLPNIGMMIWVGAALSVFNCVFMAAALVRRLHDGGLPGAIVLIPLAAVAYNTWAQFAQLGKVEELLSATMAAQSSAEIVSLQPNGGIDALLAWVPLLVTAAIGLVKSRPAANRLGEPPAE